MIRAIRSRKRGCNGLESLWEVRWDKFRREWTECGWRRSEEGEEPRRKWMDIVVENMKEKGLCEDRELPRGIRARNMEKSEERGQPWNEHVAFVWQLIVRLWSIISKPLTKSQTYISSNLRKLKIIINWLFVAGRFRNNYAFSSRNNCISSHIKTWTSKDIHKRRLPRSESL